MSAGPVGRQCMCDCPEVFCFIINLNPNHSPVHRLPNTDHRGARPTTSALGILLERLVGILDPVAEEDLDETGRSSPTKRAINPVPFASFRQGRAVDNGMPFSPGVVSASFPSTSPREAAVPGMGGNHVLCTVSGTRRHPQTQSTTVMSQTRSVDTVRCC